MSSEFDWQYVVFNQLTPHNPQPASLSVWYMFYGIEMVSLVGIDSCSGGRGGGWYTMSPEDIPSGCN